jgi:class 3 adenylate cyclase
VPNRFDNWFVPADTRYAKSGDVSVAYQVTGEGEIDLVWAPGTVSHLELDWELPAKAQVIEDLGRFARVIRFDKRGTGLSDRPTDAATLEERTDDIRAVMDAAGSERAALFGLSEGGSMAAVFAATYPQRTRCLILWGVQARWLQAEDYPWGMTPGAFEAMIEMISEEWPSLEYLLGPGAGVGRDADPALVDWMMRYARSSASPAAIVALERVNAVIDIRDVVPAIRVPTLVMNRAGDPVAHVEAARDLAARIDGASFIEFPGDTHSLSAGPESERILQTIEEFVTGNPAPVRTTRMLGTIVFVDVVASTERAAALGDSGWSELLGRYYNRAERELSRHAGEEVDRAGDGLVALFDGPTRAIRCAQALVEAARELGLELRAGLHTGEIERAAGAVRGIAIHLAARVAAKADAGEVLVTSTVRDLVAGSGLELEDRGVYGLKGFEEPRQLFGVAG